MQLSQPLLPLVSWLVAVTMNRLWIGSYVGDTLILRVQIHERQEVVCVYFMILPRQSA